MGAFFGISYSNMDLNADLDRDLDRDSDCDSDSDSDRDSDRDLNADLNCDSDHNYTRCLYMDFNSDDTDICDNCGKPRSITRGECTMMMTCRSCKGEFKKDELLMSCWVEGYCDACIEESR